MKSTDGGPYVKSGEVCLTPQQAKAAGAAPVLTPAMVATAFRRLHWPTPTTNVQPVGGTTLVNLRTNFYTTLTAPQTQTVTLLGLHVTIEATPDHYTWHYGDRSTPLTTTTPGSPYPDLTVTHRYLAATAAVHPATAVTYTGRYRVGRSPWHTIPGTLTRTGPATTLRVTTATPHLLGAG